MIIPSPRSLSLTEATDGSATLTNLNDSVLYTLFVSE
jgi:hypothetical protein